MRTLVLWDIDHTLIAAGPLTRKIYETAFTTVTGRTMATHGLPSFAGRTDRAIITETLLMHGIETSEPLLQRLSHEFAAGFGSRIEEIRDHGRVLPGAREALAALAARPDVVQSVLTGNMKPIAISKLAAFSLDEYVDFEIGAYGLDHGERPPLVRLAQVRAADKYGGEFDEHGTVLVGDTPYDVQAGHHGGARVVAVATGASDEAALRRAGAELVLADLADTDAVVRAVLGTTA
ncbi:haloacid dehalogenase-like hydrolase [Streptosporangium sp. NPDC051023]|uniref:HAD family hydrolase n=1 Tax=Streptosporangium sp. NPDC051023 TaxID=3155410 RepID=UPI00344CE80F